MSLKKASLCLSALLVVGGCKPDPEFSAVTVTCEPAPVPATRPAQCTASATDQDGKSFEVPGFTWTSSEASVAKVDSTGRVTTFTPGTTTISASATADGVTHQGQATLTVANEAQPTRHSTPITTNETWREAENPHVVTGSIEVGGAGSLTLEPGVRIRFDQDAELRVTQGALRAMGTQEAPILMVANQSAPTKGYWRGVAFAAAGSASELNSVTLSDCGRDTGEGACIAMKNQAAPVLRNVTVRNSDIVGVKAADDDSGFGTGSTMLSVSDSGSYAVVIGANQASTLPTGVSFTGNLQNAVEIRGNVSRTQTWPNLGIPYDVNDIVRVQGATPPTLTLSAGTVLRFGPNDALYVGDTAAGGLVVGGTAASPVLLTANSASPQPGHWGGVHLWSKTSNARLSYTTIEYAGADPSNTEVGGLTVYGDMAGGGARPVINNVTLRKSGSLGVLLKEGGAFGPGSTVLSIFDSYGPAIEVEPNYVGTLPTGGTISGNENGASDAVLVFSGRVLTTQTWPNLGTNVYYVIRGNVDVGSASNPTLTLRPGTDVRFFPSSELRVGANGQPGALIAEGTATAPIRFQPAQLPPSPGAWRGIHFWEASGSKLDHVIVSHAGLKGTSGFGTGNVNVHQEIGGFITNSTFSDSSGCGLSRADGSYTDSTWVTTDFTLPAYNNTFANNAGGDQCTNINIVN